MASILGTVGFKGAPAYVAARHGVVGFTKAAALEFAGFGIRVVAVCPAFIRESDEVASLVAYLASDEAAFITGAPYLVDGGYTAQ